MPSRLLDKDADLSRDKVFWLIASAMILGQLVTFSLLCSHQVRKAEVRDASAKVERMAVADCLRYIPGATVSSCAARVAPDRDATVVTVAQDQARASAGAPRAQMSTAVPVNFVYR
jgi:hypothetical protein